MDYHNECGAMFYKTDQPISAQNSLKTRATHRWRVFQEKQQKCKQMYPRVD